MVVWKSRCTTPQKSTIFLVYVSVNLWFDRITNLPELHYTNYEYGGLESLMKITADTNLTTKSPYHEGKGKGKDSET